MRIVSPEGLAAALGVLPASPRVVAGDNFATPWHALAVLDSALAEYRLFMLNAQAGVPGHRRRSGLGALAQPGEDRVHLRARWE